MCVCVCVCVCVYDCSPDIFRFIDHDGNGDMSKDEWMTFIQSIMGMMSSPEEGMQAVMDFMFTVMDKDDSKTLEVEEVIAFNSKILEILMDFARAAIECLARSAREATEKEAVDQAFAALDADGDGLLTAEEVFGGFPAPLLDVVMQVPKLLKGAAEDTCDLNTAKSAKELMKTLKLFVQLATVGAGKEAFFEKVKSDMVEKLEWGLGAFNDAFKDGVGDEYAATFKAQQRHLTETVEGMKTGVFDKDLRALSDSIFDVIDQDGDGTISASEVKVYTDMFLEECVDSAAAKSRLLAVFNALDLNGNGVVSKDELMALVGKIGSGYFPILLFCNCCGKRISN